MNKQTIGKNNPLDICLCYLNEKVDQNMLQTILERIKEIRNEDLVMSDLIILLLSSPLHWIKM